MNELRQITSCPESKNGRITSSKRDVVLENIIDAVRNDHKVLVFANYINSIEGICKELEKNNIKYLCNDRSNKGQTYLCWINSKMTVDIKYL